MIQNENLSLSTSSSPRSSQEAGVDPGQWTARISEAVQEIGQPLLRYCHHLVCDYHDAQDLVQSTFIKAYHRQAHYKGGSFHAWLYRIAYTTCLDHLRWKKRRSLLSLSLQQAASQPYGEQQGEIFSDGVLCALSQLSAKDRGILLSRIMEGRSYQEMSEIYHLSEAALRKRYERAKKKLAELLKKQTVKQGGADHEIRSL